jgi:hypothetical protein
MPDNAQVYRVTLERAATLVRDEHELALLLKVTPSHLELWLQGRVPPPVDVFLRAVDLIDAYDRTPGSA